MPPVDEAFLKLEYLAQLRQSYNKWAMKKVRGKETEAVAAQHAKQVEADRDDAASHRQRKHRVRVLYTCTTLLSLSTEIASPKVHRLKDA
jgi:hypothetical protein